jgi:prepilin-type N-terminal cleavage/methylation domain-containing protein
MSTRNRSTAASSRRAFTLLEVLIVVGVILILASLVVAVSTALLKRAEKTQTETAMNIVESAMNEYEAVMGRPLTYDGATTPLAGATLDIIEPANPTGVPSPNGTTIGRARAQGVYALNLLQQIDSVRPILAGIPQDLLRDDKTTYPATTTGYQPSQKPRSELVDTWGNRILFVFPGRPYRFGVDTGLPDPDGTVRTATENLFGVCANRRICLVSSGPDGLFGIDNEISPNPTQALRDAARADNIFLYELDPTN